MLNDPGDIRHKFQLTEGGLAHRLEIRLGLKRQTSPLVPRRAVLSMLLTWIPLLLLSAVQGNAIGSNVAIPFLRDFAAHARFLFAVPLLILAEAILGPRLETAADYFIDSNLVVGEDIARFQAAVAQGLRWRDSAIAELVLILLSYAAAALSLSSTAVHVSTWYAVRQGSAISLTMAGWWFVLLCVPLLHFLTLRWLWRMFLWAQFLWRMSHLDLRLVPTHPDRAGGLTFVGDTERFFGVILFAFSIPVSGVLANEIVYDHQPLTSFAPMIAMYVVIAVSVVLSPVLVFFATLFQAKRIGLYQYGTLATEYTLSFHKKWICQPRLTEETLLGSGDIQSLADLGNSYSFVEKMGSLPMGPRTPVNLLVACLIPMTPLLLTVMPFSEILKMMLKTIL